MNVGNTVKTVFLKLTHAIVVAGEVIGAGKLIEVTEREARDLLNRGKAKLATLGDGETPAASSGTVERPLHPDVAAYELDRAGQDAEDAANSAEQGAPSAKGGKLRKTAQQASTSAAGGSATDASAASASAPDPK